MSKDEVFQDIVNLIVKKFNREEVRMDSFIERIEDLGFSSYERIVFSIDLEDKYGIEFDFEEHLNTIEDCVNYIVEKCK